MTGHSKVMGWGYYYLSTVLDDFSRYILACKLTAGMSHTDVQETLDMATEKQARRQIIFIIKDMGLEFAQFFSTDV